MLFSYAWLQEFLQKKLPPPRELERVLTMHAFEVEGVRRYGADWLLDVSIPANRMPDAGSHAGLAQEIAALTRNSFAAPRTRGIRVERGTLGTVSTKIQAPGLVPRYSALVIQGVRVGRSPRWLRGRLEAMGINAINTVVDLTNYVMREVGQPLHAFDADTIQGGLMRVRLSRDGELIQTLDKDELRLGKGMLVIEDRGGLIDLAGIKGGRNSGITPATKNIALQAAVFDAGTIYGTKKRLDYATPAADLYATGLDPNGTVPALERALELLSRLGGGRVVQNIDLYPRKEAAKTIALEAGRVSSLLGFPMSRTQLAEILGGAGFQVSRSPSRRGELLTVRVPTRRRDISLPEDLVEEVARIYGYEHIPAVFPQASFQAQERNWGLYWRERVRDALKELGLAEAYTYSFIGERDKKTFGFSGPQLVELENPLSEDVKYPRPSLLPNLLRATVRNQRQQGVSRLFEVGRVYGREGGKPREEELMSAVLTDASFYDIKGIVESLLAGLGIGEVTFLPQAPASALWDKASTALVKAGGRELGLLGAAAPALAQNLKLKGTVVQCSLSLEKLGQLASQEQEFQALSRYPASFRDVALLVPRGTKVADVMNVMNRAGGKEVRDIDLFDMFSGSSLPEGRESLAFRIRYQSETRTLTGGEVEALHGKILAALAENPAWEIRE